MFQTIEGMAGPVEKRCGPDGDYFEPKPDGVALNSMEHPSSDKPMPPDELSEDSIETRMVDEEEFLASTRPLKVRISSRAALGD